MECDGIWTLQYPRVFQQLLNVVYEDGMGKFVAVYLDDSRNGAEHADHHRRTLLRLREIKLSAQHSKCHFAQTEVVFRGHVLTSKGLEMNQHKVSAL
jgi:hypothetical protein